MYTADNIGKIHIYIWQPGYTICIADNLGFNIFTADNPDNICTADNLDITYVQLTTYNLS